MKNAARFWSYATSFGAAWGIWELTVGSFLHALSIPFGGALLASAAAGINHESCHGARHIRHGAKAPFVLGIAAPG